MTIYNRFLRAGLLTAMAGGVLPDVALAQVRSGNGQRTMAAPASQTRTMPQANAAPAGQPVGPDGKTDVQRQLELLYQQNGRQMPEMSSAPQAPAGGRQVAPPAQPTVPQYRTQQPGGQPTQNSGGYAPYQYTGSGQPTAANSQAAAPQPAPQAAKSATVGGFFKRLVGNNSASKAAPAAPASPPPSYSSTMQQQQQQLQSQYGPGAPSAPPSVPPSVPAAELPPEPIVTIQAESNMLPEPYQIPRPTTRTAAATPIVRPKNVSQPAPVVKFDIVPATPSETVPEPLSIAPQRRDARPEASGAIDVVEESQFGAEETNDAGRLSLEDDFPDPFSEMSEAAADGRSTRPAASPFSGRTLPARQQPASLPVADAEEEDETEETEEMDDALPDPLPLQPAATGSAPRLLPTPSSSELPRLPLGTESAAPARAPLKIPQQVSSTRVTSTPDSASVQEKMIRIQSRSGAKGLKGFCPVALRDLRELIDAEPNFQTTYRGQRYFFSTAEAKAKFDRDPAKYAPAAYGADVVQLIRDQDVVEGTLDFAAWYRGKLYLFASQESHDTFGKSPETYANPAGLD